MTYSSAYAFGGEGVNSVFFFPLATLWGRGARGEARGEGAAGSAASPIFSHLPLSKRDFQGSEYQS